jgi:hypothetical protein
MTPPEPAMPAMPDNDNLELHYSRPMAVMVGLLVLASLASTLPLVLALVQFNALAILGIGALAILGPIYFLLLRYVLRALLSAQPVVRLDALGVTDTRQRVDYVSWDDVQRVRLGMGNRASTLCLELKPAAASRYTRAPGGWRLLMRYVETLGDWNVNLMPLRCSRTEVLAAAEALRKAAIRRRVEQLNGAAAGAGDSDRGA